MKKSILWLLVTCFGILALAGCSSLPPPGSVPIRIDAREGGLFGPNYHFTSDGTSVDLSVRSEGQEGAPDKHRATPTPEEWEAFRLVVVESGIAGWEKEYVDFEVLDGTQWSFEIDYSEQQFSSFGSNDWPEGDGYTLLLQALFTLVGYSP